MDGGGDGFMMPVYDVSTINGKMLGFGEPVRVKQGERVMLHVLNSSPTEVHWVALTGQGGRTRRQRGPDAAKADDAAASTGGTRERHRHDECARRVGDG